MKAKTPHRPERCRECFHGVPCTLYGRDMGTNYRGEPWENWKCRSRSVIRKQRAKERKGAQ